MNKNSDLKHNSNVNGEYRFLQLIDCRIEADKTPQTSKAAGKDDSREQQHERGNGSEDDDVQNKHDAVKDEEEKLVQDCFGVSRTSKEADYGNGWQLWEWQLPADIDADDMTSLHLVVHDHEHLQDFRRRTALGKKESSYAPPLPPPLPKGPKSKVSTAAASNTSKFMTLTNNRKRGMSNPEAERAAMSPSPMLIGAIGIFDDLSLPSVHGLEALCSYEPQTFLTNHSTASVFLKWSTPAQNRESKGCISSGVTMFEIYVEGTLRARTHRHRYRLSNIKFDTKHASRPAITVTVVSANPFMAQKFSEASSIVVFWDDVFISRPTSKPLEMH